jgi:GTP-sensing pleiotropic transcriptional regulator CodY
MQHSRQDVVSAVIVDEGLELQRSDGRYHAACFMDEHGITTSVIVRVMQPGALVRQKRNALSKNGGGKTLR